MVAATADALVVLGFGSGDELVELDRNPLPMSSIDVAVADLNKDGIADVAVLFEGLLMTWVGSVEGDLTPETELPWTFGAGARLHVGDFTGDGELDLLVVSSSGVVEVFAAERALASPLALTGPTLSSLTTVGSGWVADVDLDGRLDLVGALSGMGGLHVVSLRGQGDGTLAGAAPGGGDPTVIGPFVLARVEAGGAGVFLGVSGNADAIVQIRVPLTEPGSGSVVRLTDRATEVKGFERADLDGDLVEEVVALDAQAGEVLVYRWVGDTFELAATGAVAGAEHLALVPWSVHGPGRIAVAAGSEVVMLDVSGAEVDRVQLGADERVSALVVGELMPDGTQGGGPDLVATTQDSRLVVRLAMWVELDGGALPRPEVVVLTGQAELPYELQLSDRDGDGVAEVFMRSEAGVTGYRLDGSRLARLTTDARGLVLLGGDLDGSGVRDLVWLSPTEVGVTLSGEGLVDGMDAGVGATRLHVGSFDGRGPALWIGSSGTGACVWPLPLSGTDQACSVAELGVADALSVAVMADFFGDGTDELVRPPGTSGLRVTSDILGQGVIVGGTLASPSVVIAADMDLDGLPDVVAGASGITVLQPGTPWSEAQVPGFNARPLALSASGARFSRPQLWMTSADRLFGIKAAAGSYAVDAGVPFRAGTTALLSAQLDPRSPRPELVALAGAEGVVLGIGSAAGPVEVGGLGVDSPLRVASEDLNHDGWADLVVLRSASAEAVVLLSGPGGLVPVQRLQLPGGSRDLGFVDVDGDGRLELVVVSEGGASVWRW